MEDDGEPGFQTAIDLWQPRAPRHFVLRYNLQVEKALLFILRYIEMEHVVLTYKIRLPRRGLVKRHWLPGYMFVSFDIEMDRWRQVRRAPGFISFLGSPTPIDEAIYHDLVVRCPENLPDNDELTVIPVGSTVMILDGVFEYATGVVSRSESDMVCIETVVFNRITQVVVHPRHVRII